MNFLPNIILSNLFLIIIWISYELLLSKIRYFQANRFFLLGGSVLAVVLPWLPWQININTHSNSILGLPLAPVTEPLIDPSLPVGSGITAPLPDPANWLGIAYLSIVLFLVVVSVGQMVRLFVWTKNRPIKWWNNHRIVVLNKPWSAFSFLRTIYYPEPFDPEANETRTILEHEKVHSSQLHSVDNLVILFIRILFFYNPAIYFIAGKLRLSHEFIADEATAGHNKAEYSHTLISHQFMVPRLILMHSFNTKSFLNSRLIMLLKNKQNHMAGWKYLLVLPLLGGMVLLSGWSASAQDQAKKTKEEIAKMAVEKELTKAGFSKAEIDEIKWRIDGSNSAVQVTAYKVPLSGESDNKANTTKAKSGKSFQPDDNKAAEMEEEYRKVFLIVEEMPEFQGGKIDKFIGWVQANVKYPAMAMENKITGTVYVSFIVDRKGEVKDITILRSVDPILDDAVVSVLKTSPEWKPGKQRGVTVNVSFSIPVKFNLN